MTKKNAAYFICLNLILMTLIGCDNMATLFHGDKPEVPSNNPVPVIPSGLKTTALSKNEIMVSWTAVNEANTYEVYDGIQSHTTAFPYTVISGLNPDTSYQFSVRAGNGHGWSGASSPVSGKTQAADTMETPTEAPGGLSTETLSSAEIRVNWNTVSGANSYMVFYGTEAAGSSQYGGTASGLSLTITGLEPGTTYYFTVKAGNSAGWSAGSAPVSGTTADLAAPSGLNISAQFSTSMDISWNAVSGAASYKIYRDNSAVGISNTAAYTDTGLTAGTTYSYKVSAVSSNGTEGPRSSSVNGTTLAPSLDPLPGTPEGVGTTVLSFTEIRVNWNAVSGADSYMVYYGTEAAGSSQYGGTASSSPFTVTGLQPGTAYYFTVKAGNNAGWSNGSSPVSGTTTALAVPSGLSVSAQSSGAMTISWNAVSGAASYNIYRSNSSSGPFTGIGAGNTTAYTDMGLTANTTYWYKVSAVNGTEGAQSAAVSGTTNDTILAAPTGLSATAQSASGMTISWSVVSGAASYKIYRLNSSSGAFTNIGASNTTSYSDTGLTAGTMYYYAVSAVTGGGTEGARSGTVSGVTLSPPDVDLFVGSSISAVSGVTNLSGALAWIKINATASTTYTIQLKKDVSFAPYSLDSPAVNNKNGVTIVLKGRDTERKITLNANGTLFTVNSGVTFILDDKITLVGRSSNSNSLVRVEGGTLIIKNGAKISGNTFDYSSSPFFGAGVEVVNGGTFTMSGGEISGNTGGWGSVYIANDGTFTMNTGRINGNTHHTGVYVSGTFTMSGGEISGNGIGVAPDGVFMMNDGKISDNTNGVCVAYGTFIMSGGEISGNNGGWGGYGGGVNVYENGTFTMSGGEISGNYAREGGGVYVWSYMGGTFTKASTGGIIYGDTNTTHTTGSNENTATSGNGHAVYIQSSRKRNTTVNAGDALDSRVYGSAGGWE
ncbi:hypothetical protein AGMMS49587_02790 [Spirochaetia bacterium]|nr:hypothetical protein AGMMS49587_02790 [Spirochaetia bacterium]